MPRAIGDCDLNKRIRVSISVKLWSVSVVFLFDAGGEGREEEGTHGVECPSFAILYQLYTPHSTRVETVTGVSKSNWGDTASSIIRTHRHR